MDIRKLQRAIVDGLEDVKAQDITVFNTEHLTPLFERVIIASGTSNRQTKALASSVRESVKSRGMDVLRTEGEDHGEWIIVDCGAAVAHIMQPAIRDYYHLEEIWGGKSVKMKLATHAAGLPKAAETEPALPVVPARSGAGKPEGRRAEQAAGSAPRKAVGVKAAPRKAAGRKTAAQPAAPAARTGPARSSAVRKAAAKAPARKPVAARKTGVPRKPGSR